MTFKDCMVNLKILSGKMGFNQKLSHGGLTCTRYM